MTGNNGSMFSMVERLPSGPVPRIMSDAPPYLKELARELEAALRRVERAQREEDHEERSGQP